MAKEKSKFNIKDQLAGIAALIAAIVAIGGGFVKYGEIQTKLDVLSEQTGPDLTPLAQQIGNNQKMISENISGISDNAKSNAVLEKEIELLKLQLEEIKVNTSNPLTSNSGNQKWDFVYSDWLQDFPIQINYEIKRTL